MVRSLFDYDKYGNKHILFTTGNKYFFLPFCLFANFSSFLPFCLFANFSYTILRMRCLFFVYFCLLYHRLLSTPIYMVWNYWTHSLTMVDILVCQLLSCTSYNKLIIISTFTFNNREREYSNFILETDTESVIYR